MSKCVVAAPSSVAEIAPAARELAKLLWEGGLRPPKAEKYEHLAVRIIAGWEVGLSPVVACSNVMVMNGRATVWGDAALAIIFARGIDPAKFHERLEGEGDERVAVCSIERNGVVKETRFSVADAKKAKLWTKAGPWTEYPERMLKMRARAWAIRDGCADLLLGLGIGEEAEDIPTVEAKAVSLISDQQLNRLAELRLRAIAARGIDATECDIPRIRAVIAAMWSEILSPYHVKPSPVNLTEGLALWRRSDLEGYVARLKKRTTTPRAKRAD
jgi:hypothetical protein